MSFWNFRRLLPARKAWRVFTTKLQTKLHKLRRSRPMKKPNNQLNRTAGKPFFRPALYLQPRFKHRRRIPHRRHYRLQKRIELVPVLKEHLQPSTSAAAANANAKKIEIEDGMKHITADDMWESMALESPQMMHGINERAEEFITRFRADMLLQETLADHHL